jgi:glutaminase
MPDDFEAQLAAAVARSRMLTDGAPASYIPELATVPIEHTSVAVTLADGRMIAAGDHEFHRFTLQSSAKLVVLAGLLEERGGDAVFSVVGTEPTGGSFANVSQLESQPKPANPLVNAGAIALVGLLDGNLEDRMGWIERWAERLYGARIAVNNRVWASERRTGDRNRAIAWLLKSAGRLDRVDEVLEAYFALCSLEAGVVEASHLPAVLATGGIAPRTGERVISGRTAATVVALMATCGMYDESGAHLVSTGLPAKSGVSGVIVAVATGRAGIAVASPRVNPKGGSVRGHAILEDLSASAGWHFALPPQAADARTGSSPSPNSSR